MEEDASLILSKERIDPLSKDLKLSKYVNENLSQEARNRYVVKLLFNYGRFMLPDPYCLDDGWTDDPHGWPELIFGDIFFYLIERPGQFTRESLKAYKSLQAYNYVISGHVQTVYVNQIADDVPYCVLKAKVVPSQRVSEKAHEPWVYLNKTTAEVYCGHCTCMAGLGEVCSHVAALLFKIEIGVKSGFSTVSCTSDACEWNKAFRKEVQPMDIPQLQGLIKGRRNKMVPSVTPSSKDPLPDRETLLSLKAVCPNAVFFTCIPRLDPEETETASETGEHQRILPPLRDFFEKENTSLQPDELQQKAKRVWDEYKCSDQQIQDLEEQTRAQSISPLWFEHRKGRITGTKAHDVLVLKDTTDPRNLVKRITGTKTYNLSKKKEVKWGADNEEKAKSKYLEENKVHHKHLKIKQTGLLIDKQRLYLGASADGLINCDCCEPRVLEIKCPFKHKNKLISEALADKKFCLDRNMHLKIGHQYYTQVQLQMLIHKVGCCDFFVYTNVDCITVEVKIDLDFCAKLLQKTDNFFFRHVLPELLTRKLENGQTDVLDSLENYQMNGDQIETWCLCQEPEYGRMVTCSNTDCPIQKFHYECVNIRRCPRGDWLCPECLY